MSKVLGPKCRLCRRLGVKLCSKGERGLGAKCALVRRAYPPGVHGQKGYGRLTDYGLHLKEKQKLKVLYGIMERQLRKYFEEAKRFKSNTGLKLIETLERRFDNVVFRLGLANSRRQARQLVNHGHFLVNGKKMDIPSCIMKKGDAITVKKAKMKEKGPLAENLKMMAKKEIPTWLAWDETEQRGVVLEFPDGKNLDVGVDVKLIVEHYSR
jgi:small subunit ribosomal protein S4